MRIRRATEADRETLRELWEEFEAEIPNPLPPAESWDEAWADVSRHMHEGLVLLAEDDEGPAAHVYVAAPEHGRAHITDVYVRPRARRRGLTKALLREAVDELKSRGVERVWLEVSSSNALGRTVWERLGFTEVQRVLATDLAALERRLASDAAPESFASLHVQTDAERAVESAVRKYVPRLGRSQGTLVAPPRNGWTAVYDERCDRDGRALRRLARELSNATGAVVLTLALESGNVVRYALVDRGQTVDEYASVPEFHGPLPPGDVVALSANPTVVARLTGADPAEIRAVARTATSPADLPPAPVLLAELARVLGVEGGEHGYANAPDLPGAVRVAPG